MLMLASIRHPTFLVVRVTWKLATLVYGNADSPRFVRPNSTNPRARSDRAEITLFSQLTSAVLTIRGWGHVRLPSAGPKYLTLERFQRSSLGPHQTGDTTMRKFISATFVAASLFALSIPGFAAPGHGIWHPNCDSLGVLSSTTACN
jgi:hypothetical protein